MDFPTWWFGYPARHLGSVWQISTPSGIPPRLEELILKEGTQKFKQLWSVWVFAVSWKKAHCFSNFEFDDVTWNTGLVLYCHCLVLCLGGRLRWRVPCTISSGWEYQTFSESFGRWLLWYGSEREFKIVWFLCGGPEKGTGGGYISLAWRSA